MWVPMFSGCSEGELAETVVAGSHASFGNSFGMVSCGHFDDAA